MKKILLVAILFLVTIHSCYADGNYTNITNISPAVTLPGNHAPVEALATYSFLNDNFWSIFWGGVVGFLLVYLTEWLKTPSAKIELLPEMILTKRKFLKVRVRVYAPWWKKFFPWQNASLVGRLKGHLIDIQNGREIVLKTYTVKWDTRPEPWDYVNSVPRLELLPAASEPQNFVCGDEDTASVLVKHANHSGFLIYDANYYVNQRENIRSEKEIKLRLIFTSSSTTAKKDFIITNSGRALNSFSMTEKT